MNIAMDSDNRDSDDSSCSSKSCDNTYSGHNGDTAMVVVTLMQCQQ